MALDQVAAGFARVTPDAWAQVVAAILIALISWLAGRLSGQATERARRRDQLRASLTAFTTELRIDGDILHGGDDQSAQTAIHGAYRNTLLERQAADAALAVLADLPPTLQRDVLAIRAHLTRYNALLAHVGLVRDRDALARSEAYGEMDKLRKDAHCYDALAAAIETFVDDTLTSSSARDPVPQPRPERRRGIRRHLR
jgi:hypothetical protein